MQILVVSDLHYTLRQPDWVWRRRCTTISWSSLAICSTSLDRRADAQIAAVSEYLTRLAATTTVAVCSGNHDLDATNRHGERAARWLEAAVAAGVYVDGMRHETEHELVTVCPWWDGPSTRDGVDTQLDADAELVGDRRWIWVYHGPPDASPTSWTAKRHYGDEALVGWIERHQPDIVLCGHVHQSPFATGGAWSDRIGETSVFNAGRQTGPVPTRIELDTATGVATWFSLAGVEELVLGVGIALGAE